MAIVIIEELTLGNVSIVNFNSFIIGTNIDQFLLSFLETEICGDNKEKKFDAFVLGL